MRKDEETTADQDRSYCEPTYVPGDEVVERATGEIVVVRTVIPIAICGRVVRFIYVGDQGAWTGDELTALAARR